MRLTLLLAFALGALLVAQPAGAQVSPTVIDGGVENGFPDEIVFLVSAASDSPVERIRLRYTVLPDGSAAVAEADVEPGTTVSARFVLQTNNPPSIYLSPGTTIQYRWEGTDADGDTAITEMATFFYDDIRFDWSSMEADGVTVYFYSGFEDDARAMLAAGSETIATMSELLGTSVEFPVNVWIYRSTNDMQPALQRRSETYEQSVTTAGVRVASDTVLVLGNVSFDTLRHELTHVVTAVAGEGPFGTLPAWLDEGTAVYAQSSPGGFGDAVERAVDRDSLLSLGSISSYPGDPDNVNLFYGESWSLVSYLIDTYGAADFAQLFAEFQSGESTSEALIAVYGVDRDGLEDEWRVSLGLAPRNQPEPTEVPPLSIESPGDDDGEMSTTLVLFLVAGVLGLAGVVALVGVTLARRVR